MSRIKCAKMEQMKLDDGFMQNDFTIYAWYYSRHSKIGILQKLEPIGSNYRVSWFRFAFGSILLIYFRRSMQFPLASTNIVFNCSLCYFGWRKRKVDLQIMFSMGTFFPIDLSLESIGFPCSELLEIGTDVERNGL